LTALVGMPNFVSAHGMQQPPGLSGSGRAADCHRKAG
jgi:hypothetical protein